MRVFLLFRSNKCLFYILLFIRQLLIAVCNFSGLLCCKIFLNQTISGHTADFLLFRRIFLFSQCTSPLLFCPLSLNLIRFSTHQSIGSGILRISVCKRYDYISVKKQPFSCITVIYKRNLMLGNIQFLRKDLLIPAVLI